MSVFLSCEVGGDHVPKQFANAVKSIRHNGEAEQGHSVPSFGQPDTAARYIAQRMSRQLGAPLVCHENSIDLIDVSRSRRHRQLYSAMTRDWPADLRRELLQSIYEPYRQRIQAAISRALKRWSFVVHLSVRTFPLWRQGKVHRADLGLLYDPSVDDEVDFCIDWIDEMYEQLPMLRVRRNYPRRGTADSITKAMRGEFSGQEYLGIEMWFNRAWAGRELLIRDEVIDGICNSLQTLTNDIASDAA